MKIMYAPLTGYDFDWIEEALNEHFSWIKQANNTMNFWVELNRSTMEFMLKHRNQMAGVVGLRPMLTNSALTFYPQLEKT